MTGEERTTIIGYRKDGYGYKKISQLTGISENTIKTFCKRNGLGNSVADIAPPNGETICKCCGAHITQFPGRKSKKFCSDSCRNRWWNAHLDMVKRKAVYEFTCPACGKSFTAYGNAHRKYCCHACYIADRFGGRHDR